MLLFFNLILFLAILITIYLVFFTAKYENIINSKFFKKQRLNDNESVIFNKWKNLFFVQIFLIFICIILKFLNDIKIKTKKQL